MPMPIPLPKPSARTAARAIGTTDIPSRKPWATSSETALG